MGINQREQLFSGIAKPANLFTRSCLAVCRTEDMCRELAAQGVEELVIAKTGLPIDPYFLQRRWRGCYQECKTGLLAKAGYGWGPSILG